MLLVCGMNRAEGASSKLPPARCAAPLTATEILGREALEFLTDACMRWPGDPGSSRVELGCLRSSKVKILLLRTFALLQFGA